MWSIWLTSCVQVCVYTIMIYKDGMIVSMCPCVLSAASGIVHYWINKPVWCTSILHPCRYCIDMDVFVVSICIIINYYILLLIILQDMASVWSCCNIWCFCVFAYIYLSLIHHFICTCLFMLATVCCCLCYCYLMTVLSQAMTDCLRCWCKHVHLINVIVF